MKFKFISVLLITFSVFFLMQVKAQTVSTLNVSGHGESVAKPDIATLNIGASSRGKTANEATALNSTSVQKLINTLTMAGILEKDIKTNNVSVFPVYKPTRPSENDFNDVNKILGYEASNYVQAKIRNVNDVGRVIDLVTLAGDYTISGLDFGLEKDDSFEAEALKEAVKDARAKADVVAEAAGVSIAGIKNITVGTSFSPIFKGFSGAEAAAADTPVLPGETTVTQDVSIEYLLDK